MPSSGPRWACSTPRTLQGIGEQERVTGFLLTKDADDVVEYGLAVANPTNHIQYLEIDTDDPEVVVGGCMAWDDLYAIPPKDATWSMDLPTAEAHVRDRWPDAILSRRQNVVTGAEYLSFKVIIDDETRGGICFDQGGIELSDGSPADWADTLAWYQSLLPPGATLVAMTEHNQNLTPFPDDATPTQIQQLYERLVAEI